MKAAACGRDDTTESENPEGKGKMLLKNVYQWDICNQEDLDIFSAESLEIDQSAARTLYRTDWRNRKQQGVTAPSGEK